ncbi:metallophosphoesterase [bacterium]|nr:metallophosphoesterase [bacterium]
MKRGDECRQLLIVTGVLMSISVGCVQNKRLLTRHSFSDDKATIEVGGLTTEVTVLHITDSHISVFDAREQRYRSCSARMDDAYRTVHHVATGKETAPVAAFHELMATAETLRVDVIALTGDIVNNPSPASVEYVRDALEKTGIPWIYVAGNHDWHYEGMAGAAADLRDIWIGNSLLPLYRGANPLFASRIIGGINFLTIDNSTYQITAEQLAFFKKEAEGPLPMVLLMHIPVYLPGDGERESIATCGDPRWGWDMDKNYEVERRERWSRGGNSAYTVQFLEAVRACPTLVAILAGHTHKPAAGRISETAVQYITGRSADGGHRQVCFTPLD